MKKILERDELRRLARELGVRPDWHEPDEQNVGAKVYGTSFDNAGFWGYRADQSPHPDVEELHVILWRTRYDEMTDRREDVEPIAAINLATLLAWASEPDRQPPEKSEVERTEEYWRSRIACEVYAEAERLQNEQPNPVLGAALGSIVEQVAAKIGKMPADE
jgi:hypothetical protein